MKSLLLVPHCDDETLFASHIVMRYNPDVKVVYLPSQHEEESTRRHEMAAALSHLSGVTWDPWDVEWLGGREREPMHSLEEQLSKWCPPELFLERDPDAEYYEHVFAPLPEPGGHPEHNYVGTVAVELWGKVRTTLYTTYTRTGGRTTSEGQEVELPAWMIQRKLRALAEYISQIEQPSTRPWFCQMLDLREWIV